jgi:hypothetical protein
MGWWVVEVVVYACFWGCCESFCFLVRFNRNKAINFPFLLDLICCVMGELCITMSLNHMDKRSQNSNPCNLECIILFLALKGYALSSRQSEIPSPLTQSTNSHPPHTPPRFLTLQNLLSNRLVRSQLYLGILKGK